MNPKDIPAFPVKAEPYSRDDKKGMALRDYFAAKAMQSELVGLSGMPFKEIARRAYEIADAMMEAREL